ncbi:MAG: 2-oxo acid dehydrogenase subunit E2, partial [Bacteroidetes bacterium]
MARVELIMPKMGESIMEATILKWVKQVGDRVEADETVLEIATDKVDSEVPSPVSGTLVEILYPENETVPIGKPIAVIATESEAESEAPEQPAAPQPREEAAEAAPGNGMGQPTPEPALAESAPAELPRTSPAGRFYSPLVRNIARQEGISLEELERIPGSGLKGRVTKKDILAYLEQRREAPAPPPRPTPSEP